eukprot:13817370-Alexandrium_andersonii.AAC.1
MDGWRRAMNWNTSKTKFQRAKPCARGGRGSRRGGREGMGRASLGRGGAEHRAHAQAGPAAPPARRRCGRRRPPGRRPCASPLRQRSNS